jgi:hypothetical protein
MDAVSARTIDEPWMSKASLARHFGVSTRTVERWVSRGCASRTIAGMRRFRLSDVEEFLGDTEVG